MTELYDVLIVGAGPGGAMAAKVAGENGLKAALFVMNIILFAIIGLMLLIPAQRLGGANNST